jgi:Rubrerythrin
VSTFFDEKKNFYSFFVARVSDCAWWQNVPSLPLHALKEECMKKSIFVVSLVLAVAFSLGTPTVHSQPSRGGYGMGPGMMGGWVEVPSKLPVPKSAEWVQKLKEILTLEKQSLAQYQTDEEKFNAPMPYRMIIPQEENHIAWIGQLFKAYELPADGKAEPVVQNKTLTEAYELGTKVESDLLPRYEELVKKAEDRDTAAVLNTVLLQSRWHLAMFEHALRMGYGSGYSRGSGMMDGYGYGMGPGMMDGYGNGMGRRYRRQSPATGESIDAKGAEAMMKDYLKSTRNPNLKLGKIKDAGESFETEILTQKNDLVDRILIDKKTGYIRSAY